MLLFTTFTGVWFWKQKNIFSLSKPFLIYINISSCLNIDSSFSDEQQGYLLTAASMVGEAMEEFVTNLSGEKTRKLTNSFNYFDALSTGTITSPLPCS